MQIRPRISTNEIKLEHICYIIHLSNLIYMIPYFMQHEMCGLLLVMDSYERSNIPSLRGTTPSVITVLDLYRSLCISCMFSCEQPDKTEQGEEYCKTWNFTVQIADFYYFLKFVVCIPLRVLGQVQTFRLTQHYFEYFIQ
jgi:hypothetical protein